MKTNAFSDVILQPGDDVFAVWNDTHMPEDDPQLTARFIEQDPTFGWTCTISDENGTEMEVHDFSSREDLLAYLASHSVEVED